LTEWREVCLGDYAKVLGGYAFKSTDFLPYGDYPVIKIKNIAKGYLDMSECQYISSSIAAQASRFKAEYGDILIAMTGSHITQPSSMVGRVAKYNIHVESYINQRVGKVISIDKSLLDTNFLYYFMTCEDTTYSLANIASGSANQANISSEQIESLELLLPDIDEQKAIAEVLSSLDDKIDLLTRQNKTLEDLAQAYFRKWFIENASDEWEEKGLDEIADFLNGLPLQKYPYKTGNPLYVIKIKELNNGFTDSSDLCSADIPEQYIVCPGDVIFSWSGSLQVDIWKYGKGALNQHLFKVTSRYYPKWFYYFWIKYHLPEFKMIAESKATTMGHIQRKDLSNAIVLVPDGQELNFIDNIMSPLIEKIEHNNAQVLVLQKLRDTLLPKLISGEIRVKI